MKKLPIGVQGIVEILDEGQLYVDKTLFAKQLVDEGKHYFLSRPRRFGKSLFVNTLEHIFKGNKELFKECQIYESDYDWQEHPIVHFDFSRIPNNSTEKFNQGLHDALVNIAKDYNKEITGSSPQSQMERLVASLAKQNRVVVLVDEYDKPIIDNLHKLDVAEQNRDLLRDFFGMLKSLDQYLKFTFLTGVSKFSQVSLFSGLNNLTDITMNPRYAAMMGYTEDEIKRDCKEHIEEVAKKRGVKPQAILDELKQWYNGYRFTEKELSVYNPYSTLRFLSEYKPQSYWYSTGTPSFLIEQVQKKPQSVIALKGAEALKSELSDIKELDDIDLVPLMFQTGYLTITNYREDENSYTLDFPNKEVREAFLNTLLKDFAKINPLVVMREAQKIQCAIEAYDLNSFFQTINAHFAKIAYPAYSKAGGYEGFYQAVFFTFLERSGLTTVTEMATNIGRIDIACETNKTICIFELKVDQDADTALTQAEDKKYRERFRFSSQDKSILVIGVNFSSRSKNISDWKGIVFSSDGKSVQELHGEFPDCQKRPSP
ncbi:MAG: AAA family ATPase [Simkaniaceae bacterium]|nr:AAA family ATPase [Simkaniaceae bacterium]